MALPTATTAGYTTYAGKVSCVCLAAWLPWLEKLALAHGYIRYKLDVLQLTGDYSMSGGTHNAGGVYDIKQYDTRIVALAREMGAPATWLRNMRYADGSPGNTHTHGVLSGCPHNYPAAYQITAQRRGYDGMGKGPAGSPYAGQWGYGGLDPHPDPKVYRTWKQGIEWAKAELARITGQAILDNLETVMALSTDDLSKIRSIVKSEIALLTNPKTPESRALAEAMWTAHLLLKDPIDPTGATRRTPSYMLENGSWWQRVRRGDESHDALQELANIGNAVIELKASVNALPKAEPAPEPTPLPVPALGIDVSKYQTTEQTAAALAAKPDFCIINASTGIKTVSPTLAAHRDTSRANADVTGFYHWSQTVNDSVPAEMNHTDPVGECAHFLDTAQPKVGELLALDHEEPLGTWEQRVVYAIDWLEECHRRTGARPPLYVNWSWIKGLRGAATLEQWDRLTEFDVWLADPSGTPGKHEPIDPKPGSSKGWRVVIHQYAVTDGVDRNWTADLNVLRSLAVKFIVP